MCGPNGWLYLTPPHLTSLQAVLRKPDGQYLMEEGPERVFEVPYEAGANDVFEFKVGVRAGRKGHTRGVRLQRACACLRGRVPRRRHHLDTA